jgi:hypothetical protein
VKVLHKVGPIFKYRPVHSDSLYKIKNKELIPDWYFDCKNAPRENANEVRVGDVEIDINAETSDFFFLERTICEKFERSGNNTSISWEADYLFIDKQKNMAFRFTGIFNDFFDSKFPQHKFKVQANGVCFLPYDAIDIFSLRDDLKSSNPESSGLQRLNDICEEIKEADNPVLLIGKVR